MNERYHHRRRHLNRTHRRRHYMTRTKRYLSVKMKKEYCMILTNSNALKMERYMTQMNMNALRMASKLKMKMN